MAGQRRDVPRRRQARRARHGLVQQAGVSGTPGVAWRSKPQ
jgi:hypothetical protein